MEIGASGGGLGLALANGVAEERSDESPAARFGCILGEVTCSFAKESGVSSAGAGEALLGAVGADEETSFSTSDIASKPNGTSLLGTAEVLCGAVPPSAASVAQGTLGIICAAIMASAEDV
jgi:hypothetical protein